MTRYIVLVLAVGTGIISGATVLSYVIGWPPLRTWAEPPMALNTALCLLWLSFACAFLARPERDGK